jgi:hypothetical protein
LTGKFSFNSQIHRGELTKINKETNIPQSKTTMNCCERRANKIAVVTMVKDSDNKVKRIKGWRGSIAAKLPGK